MPLTIAGHKLFGSWVIDYIFAFREHELEKTDPVFWFRMQIAMVACFVTAYPANWWLISKGIKEKM